MLVLNWTGSGFPCPDLNNFLERFNPSRMANSSVDTAFSWDVRDKHASPCFNAHWTIYINRISWESPWNSQVAGEHPQDMESWNSYPWSEWGSISTIVPDHWTIGCSGVVVLFVVLTRNSFLFLRNVSYTNWYTCSHKKSSPNLKKTPCQCKWINIFWEITSVGKSPSNLFWKTWDLGFWESASQALLNHGR